MTEELREPPLLSEEEIKRAAYERNLLFGENAVFAHTRKKDADRCIAQAERDICIKWMKEHCYLKAERELPSIKDRDPQGEDLSFGCGYAMAQHDMLQEVDGVSFKAVKEFKDVG